MTNSKKNKTHQDNFHDYSEYWKENSHKITQNVQNFFENATKKMKKNSACAKENFIKERSQTLETLSETNKILMDALKTISQLQTQYVKEAFEEMQKLAKNLSVDHKTSDLKSQNDKMENMVKDYILSNYDNIADVEFGVKRVILGSGPNEKGKTEVNQKVIMVTLDNLKNKKIKSELHEITREIAYTLERLFGVDFRTYGSEWDLKFYQIKKEEL